MTYIDRPHYECGSCFKTISSIDYEYSGWDSPSYDVHYCPDCQKRLKEGAEECQ